LVQTPVLKITITTDKWKSARSAKKIKKLPKSPCSRNKENLERPKHDKNTSANKKRDSAVKWIDLCKKSSNSRRKMKKTGHIDKKWRRSINV
jgi:hypothetical protein